MIVLILCALVVVIAASVVVSELITADDQAAFASDRVSATTSRHAELEAEKQEFISALESDKANGVLTADGQSSESNDLGLDEKYESFQADEAVKNERDLKALEVLNRLAGTDHQALPTDLKTEYATLEEMLDVLDDSMPESDRELLCAYLERHVYWIEGNDSLKLEIQNALRPYGYFD